MMGYPTFSLNNLAHSVVLMAGNLNFKMMAHISENNFTLNCSSLVSIPQEEKKVRSLCKFQVTVLLGLVPLTF